MATDNLAQALELLRSLVADLESTGSRVESADPPARVTELLADLADPATDWRTLSEPNAVWALCRKIHVAKEIYVAYDSGWRQPIDRTPLNETENIALAGMFLVVAARNAESGRDGRGPALKALNAMYYLIDDRNGGLPTTVAGPLRGIADRLLDQVLTP